MCGVRSCICMSGYVSGYPAFVDGRGAMHALQESGPPPTYAGKRKGGPAPEASSHACLCLPLVGSLRRTCSIYLGLINNVRWMI
jgi:hypothetical protein